jgi:cellulose synthase/poly-beta-1,6-N-acetylglucosamine synthase-like glycosyltransferase
MYQQIFHIANIVFCVLFGISIVLLLQKIVYHIVGLFPGKKFPEAKKDHKYAILIPARNESAVIDELLASIKNQNYDQNNLHTYVIVEREDDPTCEIVKKYENTEVFIRKRLDLKGKGHALDEVIKHIFASGEKYEAFFIFDADNVLTKNFIKEMNKTFDAGYQIALGYRNSKNWNDGWVAACSALTFSMVNTFHNKCRSRFNQNVILSGTGFYISSDILEKLGGWEFFTLTEDYELSMFSCLNNIKSTYNEWAEFYDEQPKKFKVSWNQRLRWVKGHGDVDKKYRKKLIKSAVFDKENRMSKTEFGMSVLPIVSFLISTFAYAIFTIVLGIVGACLGQSIWWKVLSAGLIALVALYLFFVVYTLVMALAERKHTNLTFWHTVACALMGPFFMASYIPIYFTTIFKKEVNWVPIIHNVKMNKASNELVELKLEESETARKIDDDESTMIM